MNNAPKSPLKVLIAIYGVEIAAEAFMEYEHYREYGVLPEGARYLQAVQHDNGNVLFIWQHEEIQ